MKHVHAWLSFAFLFIISGCGDKGNGGYPHSELAVRAPDKITSSFAFRKDLPRVEILKSALETEFLLQTNIIEQLPVPTFNALKSRVVVFTKHAGKIFMLEATAGHTVSQELPQQLVLASFDIMEENENTVAFDFGGGMRTIFNNDDWYGHDRNDGREYLSTFKFQDVRNSRLLAVDPTEKNELLIRQVAQFEKQEEMYGPTQLMTVELRYYLTPYRSDPTFVPAKEFDMKRVGYFEAAPYQGPRGTKIFSIKWDIRKPIVFAISSNTPPEFRQAVKDGVLYWNGAFETPVLQVVDGPEGVFAPDPRHNLIQWVSWDRAESAFADAHIDPRTGQVLHAQVFLPSTFAVSGKSEARKYLAQKRNAKRHSHLGLENFSSSALCRRDAEESKFTASLSKLLSAHPSDGDVLRAGQDYVRLVVAHEMGHVLGLRHNFAGNLGAKGFPLKDRREIFVNYLRHEELDEDVQPASTVMDYLPFEEEALMGHQIAKGRPMLEYDKKAIIGLYQNETYQYGEIPLFCTDSNLSQFIDCTKFDNGASVVEHVAWTTQENLRSLPADLIEIFAAAKAPGEGLAPTPVQEVSLTVDGSVESILGARDRLAGSFTSDRRVLPVFRSFPYVGPVNMESVREKERAFFLNEIERVGGLDLTFSMIPSDLASETIKEFGLLLDDEMQSTGIAASGQSYSFNSEEKARMKESVAALMEILPAKLAKKDLEVLAKLPNDWKVTSSELGDNLATVLAKRVEQYVFQEAPEKVQATIEIPAAPADSTKKEEEADAAKKRQLQVSLPKFYYPLEVRKAAPPVLKPGTDEDSLGWGLHERTHYKTKFLERLNAATGCNDDKACSFEKLKAEDVKVVIPADLEVTAAKKLQKEVTRWFLENKQVYEEFK